MVRICAWALVACSVLASTAPSNAPTNAPSLSPTAAPHTLAPTLVPTTPAPTLAPTTSAPSTSVPTDAPHTLAPTGTPSSGAPSTTTTAPTTGAPTSVPTTPAQMCERNLTLAEVAAMGANSSICPVIISDTSGKKRVYNMAAFARVHVHGANDILDFCGQDMTTVFESAPHKFLPFQGENGTVEKIDRSTVFTCLGTVVAGSTFAPTPAPVLPPSPAAPIYPCLTAGYTYTIKQAILNRYKALDHDGKSAMNGGLVRLAFHDSTTYLKTTNEGGPDGCINFDDPDNAGLAHHVEYLETMWQPFKTRISRADFWYLAAVTLIENAGGPVIPFRYGRKDCTNETFLRNNDKHRLPDAQRDWNYVKGFFGWACGFSDREITALMGGHVLGRTHSNNSGFDGPWVSGFNAGIIFDNQFYLGLMTVEWIKELNNFSGFSNRYQWNQGGVGTGLQMFLTSDVALMITNPDDPRCTSSFLDTSTVSAEKAVPKDPDCIKNNVTFLIVDEYARSKAAFFRDFAIAYQKLCELGYVNGTLLPLDTCFPGAEKFNDPPVPKVSGAGPMAAVSFFVVFLLSTLV